MELPICRIPGLSHAVRRVLSESRVLVVDDLESNLLVLDGLLRAAGVSSVHTTTDPRRVTELCLELSPDLVLLDLHMPEMDGFAVMNALRSAFPADHFLPVLVLTADATAPTRERALTGGATDFLTKPFDRTEVVLRVGNLLQCKALFQELREHEAALQRELDARRAEEQRRAEQQNRLRERIQAALASHLPKMVFQPIVDLADGSIVGVEALARFGDEAERGPDTWFADADTVGLGATLELRAMHEAMERLAELGNGAFMSVNASPELVMRSELLELVTEIPAERLVIEVTEHAEVDNYDDLIDHLAPLRRAGVRIAVDDAGTGYSGLQRILRICPDILKLDTELIRGIHRDPGRRALAAALVGFAHEIDATIVAEGIETSAELQTLYRLGVPWGQGFHLARPGTLPLSADPIEIEVEVDEEVEVDVEVEV